MPETSSRRGSESGVSVVKAPAPRAAHQRRPIAGAETTPTTISPRSSSASRVAHTGMPRTYPLVPSIGSTIQRRVPDPSVGVGLAVLLAEHRVLGTPGRQVLAHRLLDGAVGLRDRGQVGLGLDHEILGAEPGHRDRIGDAGQLQREVEVVGGAGHRAHPTPIVWSDTMTSDDLQRATIALLQELIRFDTVNPPGRERAAIEHLERYVSAAGL